MGRTRADLDEKTLEKAQSAKQNFKIFSVNATLIKTSVTFIREKRSQSMFFALVIFSKKKKKTLGFCAVSM